MFNGLIEDLINKFSRIIGIDYGLREAIAGGVGDGLVNLFKKRKQQRFNYSSSVVE